MCRSFDWWEISSQSYLNTLVMSQNRGVVRKKEGIMSMATKWLEKLVFGSSQSWAKQPVMKVFVDDAIEKIFENDPNVTDLSLMGISFVLMFRFLFGG
jgi:hypothetical protein